VLTKLRIGSQDVGITIFKLRYFIGVCQQWGLSCNSSVNSKPLTDKVEMNLIFDRASESTRTRTTTITTTICPNKINIHVAEMLSSNAFCCLKCFEIWSQFFLIPLWGMSERPLFLYLHVFLCWQRNCAWPVPHPDGRINFVDRRLRNPPKVRSGTTLACRAIQTKKNSKWFYIL